MKPITVLMITAVFSVLSLNTHSSPEKSMSVQEQTEARSRLNPHPKQTYYLRIKISDAPGPLKLMGNFGIGYKAENRLYIINRIERTPASPEKNMKTKARQLGEFEYETVVYVDTMPDEDCSREGICRWKPDGFGVAFKATRYPEETKFNFGNSLDDLMRKKALIKYYWKWSYPYSKRGDDIPCSDSVDFGTVSPEIYSAE